MFLICAFILLGCVHYLFAEESEFVGFGTKPKSLGSIECYSPLCQQRTGYYNIKTHTAEIIIPSPLFANLPCISIDEHPDVFCDVFEHVSDWSRDLRRISIVMDFAPRIKVHI